MRPLAPFKVSPKSAKKKIPTDVSFHHINHNIHRRHAIFFPLYSLKRGRGRHSGFLMSGVTKPLRAYVEPSNGCLYFLIWL